MDMFRVLFGCRQADLAQYGAVSQMRYANVLIVVIIIIIIMTNNSQCARHFACMISSNPQNKPLKYVF